MLFRSVIHGSGHALGVVIEVVVHLFGAGTERVDLTALVRDQYLDEYVYSKIWSELSDLDKKIVTEMSLSGETQVKALRERLDMKSELFSVYRERLKRKGVIISKEYGKVTLALPRFDEFVKIQQLM